MTNKDIEITVCAVLKSVIESGAPKEQWSDLTKQGLLVYREIRDLMINGGANGG